MKKNLLFVYVFISCLSKAQTTYSSFNIDLISLITPNTVDMSVDNRRYSGCWGWYQQSKNKEYAISGTSNGTYFIDVTSPASPSVCAFVQGKLGCTWREMKTYQHYCYIVSDDAFPNKFQIVDMQYLPDSVHIVHNGTTYFEKAHTIWIDHDKMYIGGIFFNANGTTGSSAPMAVFSLANPETPQLLRTLDQDISVSVVNYVHDMYARNDTVYASCANQGLFIFKLDATTYTFTQLGSFSNYLAAGYNHSSYLTQNGKYLMFCDESPARLPIHLVNVENMSNIQPVKTFTPFPGTTPHNPYILGNSFAVVSCYQDGLFIYDISNPNQAGVVGNFDTHPQGGANTGSYGDSDYRGNWGAYPFLPSGIIIAQDMQNGVFILDPARSFTATVGIPELEIKNNEWTVYPNPTNEIITIKFSSSFNQEADIKIMDVLGKEFKIQSSKFKNGNASIDVSELKSGIYFIKIANKVQRFIKE